MSARVPAHAGTFYPADPAKLRASVQQYLDAAPPPASPVPSAPKAIIAPHAGYVYSAPIAASAYKCLVPLRSIVHRVVLLGPAHHIFVRGLALSSASAFATPLGDVPIDAAAIEQIKSLPQVKLSDDAHAPEHSLEVQLPFLQCVLEEFSLVPFAVGDVGAPQIAEVLDALWGGPETLILISSDLSHYHEYDTAKAIDQETARAISLLRPQEIAFEQACGCLSIRGLLLLAGKRSLTPHLLDLRSSGDTAGTRDRVVGYGAWAFC
ncbi:MAG TPA: AmmeMemoRadiSam system protein B [Planctomycetota bacterium]|jgi:hypothetical protein